MMGRGIAFLCIDFMNGSARSSNVRGRHVHFMLAGLAPESKETVQLNLINLLLPMPSFEDKFRVFGYRMWQ